MEYLDLSMLNGRAMMLFGVVLLLTIYFYRHAGRRWVPPVFLIAAALGVAWHTGVLRQSAVDAVRGAATDKFDAAGARAAAIGGQAHSTSAGNAGESNEAYERHVKGKKK